MKAEDIARLWNESKHANDPFDMPEWRLQSTNGRDLLERFARACEKRGIERAKAHGKGNINVQSDGIRGCAWVDWSTLDAEIAKENEDG